MEASEAISLVNELVTDADQIPSNRNLFDAWRHRCTTVLDGIFGPESRQLKDLRAVNYRFFGSYKMGDSRPHSEAFRNGIDKSKELLKTFIWEIERFGVPVVQIENDSERAFKAVELICNRFPAVVRQLRRRHDDRPPLDIEDEYDVQDLLHALLKLYFDDIRPEEWTPSYAAKSNRMDFLLKKEKVVIEVKKTRKGLDAKQLGEELIIDTARYRNHSDCEKLICFVYDPEFRIANPAGIESDLQRDEEGLSVRVIITPRH